MSRDEGWRERRGGGGWRFKKGVLPTADAKTSVDERLTYLILSRF